MKPRSPIILVLALSYAVLSWVKFHEITASIVSFCSYCVLTLMEFTSPATHWRFDLLEYWIAGVVWLLAGALLLRMVLKKQPAVAKYGSAFQSKATQFLVLLMFVAFVAPFLTPLGPNVQGNLSTTRLLPPLSRAAMIESVANDTSLCRFSRVVRTSKRANQYLLERSFTFSSGEHIAVSEPSLESKVGSVIFFFGTDDNARDVFSRVVYATRISVAIGLAASIGSLLIGTLVGFAAGYSNRFVDSLLMRCTDLALSIPSLFLVIAIMAFLGKSVLTLVVVLAFTGWMGIARTVRTEVKRLREKEFVLAAKLLDQSSVAILKKHIFPNLKPMLVTAATLQFGNAVLAEASLSFLGLGIQPPTASWGNMLGQSLTYLRTGWWLGFFPGVVLALALISSHYAIEGKEEHAS